MKLVIEIDEVFYETLKKTERILTGRRNGKTLMSALWNAVAKGTPLPKGHGRLIDADVLEKEIEDYSEGPFAMTPEFLVKDSPTIIEADNAESEDVEW